VSWHGNGGALSGVSYYCLCRGSKNCGSSSEAPAVARAVPVPLVQDRSGAKDLEEQIDGRDLELFHAGFAPFTMGKENASTHLDSALTGPFRQGIIVASQMVTVSCAA
jgi:hypothetical protein